MKSLYLLLCQAIAPLPNLGCYCFWEWHLHKQSQVRHVTIGSEVSQSFFALRISENPAVTVRTLIGISEQILHPFVWNWAQISKYKWAPSVNDLVCETYTTSRGTCLKKTSISSKVFSANYNSFSYSATCLPEKFQLGEIRDGNPSVGNSRNLQGYKATYHLHRGANIITNSSSERRCMYLANHLT